MFYKRRNTKSIAREYIDLNYDSSSTFIINYNSILFVINYNERVVKQKLFCLSAYERNKVIGVNYVLIINMKLISIVVAQNFPKFSNTMYMNAKDSFWRASSNKCTYHTETVIVCIQP
jgi:hypothetical protein